MSCPAARLSGRWSLAVGQQAGEFFTAGGSGLGHRSVDVALDGTHGQAQSLSDTTVGQTLADQRYDLSLAIGEWHGFTCLTKRRSAGAAALFGQRITARRAR